MDIGELDSVEDFVRTPVRCRFCADIIVALTLEPMTPWDRLAYVCGPCGKRRHLIETIDPETYVLGPPPPTLF